MDTELLRTFLEVNRTRHFGKAAANLYLTQSAVSARIRLLEQTVGVALFTRNRNDIQLTPAGKKLLPHAETILTAWTRARQGLAVEEEGKSALTVAGAPGLWDPLLQRWLLELCTDNPGLALNADELDTDTILQRLGEKSLDLGLVYETPQVSEIRTREVTALKFIMVSSRPNLSQNEAVRSEYVLVNWGTWFSIAHARHFPDIPPPSMRLGRGWLAREFIVERGGTAYLTELMARDYLADGRLHRVPGTPVIERSVHAAYPAESDARAFVENAVDSLISVAREMTTGES